MFCAQDQLKRSDGRKIWVDPIVASIEKLPRFAQWRFQNWNEQYPLVSFQGCEIAGILLLIPWTVKTWALFPHWLYCAKNYFLKWSIPQNLGQFASFCCLRVSKHRILVWRSFLKELLTSSEPFKGRPSIWDNWADFTARHFLAKFYLVFFQLKEPLKRFSARRILFRETINETAQNGSGYFHSV